MSAISSANYLTTSRFHKSCWSRWSKSSKSWGFVQIENGIMTVNKDAEKKEIASSSIYQDLVQTVKDQELMALGSVQEIYDYLLSDDK